VAVNAIGEAANANRIIVFHDGKLKMTLGIERKTL
jgi:hypothetical protein